MGNNKIIAVNTRFLLKDKLEGIGRFTYESIKRIVVDHPEYQFHFLFDRPYHGDFLFAKNVKPIVLWPPARHPFLWYWWFEHAVKNYLHKTDPDLFISPDGYLSIQKKIPTLLVMHDLAFEHYPKQLDWLTGAYYRHYSPIFAQTAARIATVSNFTKQDIVGCYGINADKIDVVYNGAGNEFKPLDAKSQQAVRNQYTQGQPYFIFTGAIHPRKNVHQIFRAFDQYKTNTGATDKLLVVGRKAWQYGEVMEVYEHMKYQSDVIFTGHVQPEILCKMMAGAQALMYVSVFEGFGIPIIEAMQCGTPVITSNCSVMPETAGGAAILADPFKIDSIVEAMKKITVDEYTRQSCIDMGYVNAARFSWDNTAAGLWESANKILFN